MRRGAILATALAVVACLAAPPAAIADLPAISYSLTGEVGDNGWYRSPVTVAWHVDFRGLPPVASDGCEAAVPLRADSRGVVLTCRAANSDGEAIARTKVIRIDRTPPAVGGATPARAPDANGWYRSPVSVAWSGTDAMSGLAGCTSLTYGGPDGPASLTGSCRDAAGNVSATSTFALRYDATPPSLTSVTAAGGDSVATLRWRASADAVAVTVTRSAGATGAAGTMVYRGRRDRFEDVGLRNGVRYAYTVVATDVAGNAASATAVARTGSRLRAPRPGARLTAPPVLRWRAVRDATYYNVQLFRGGDKVLSAWPAEPRLRLRRAWMHRGRRLRLDAGMYRWYVWPGYGRRAERRYGRLLGSRRFAVVAAPAQ